MAFMPRYVLVSLFGALSFRQIWFSLPRLRGCGFHVQFALGCWFGRWPKLLALDPLTLGGLGIREAGLVAPLAPSVFRLHWPSPPGWHGNRSSFLLLAEHLRAGLISFLIWLVQHFARAVLKVEPPALLGRSSGLSVIS